MIADRLDVVEERVERVERELNLDGDRDESQGTDDDGEEI